MKLPSNWLLHDHSEFEELLAECQTAIDEEDWETSYSYFETLVAQLKSHMAMEEEVLYPAYESTPEFPQEPVIALREEHDRIVELVRDLHKVFRTRNSEHVLISLISLENIMVRHHEKEECVFLPMAGYLLKSKSQELKQQLQDFKPSPNGRNWDR
jgi:hemerythrin-like domain-containing protein